MPPFENETGLRAEEEEEFGRFRTKLRPYFDAMQQISVLVLIWGPGEGTTYYPKRAEIKDSLKEKNPKDEIATSEDLCRQIEHPSDVDIVQLELLHARVSDVIFGLVTSDPNQQGIFLEISHLLDFEALVNKTWLIVPDTRDWKRVTTFLQQPLLQNFPKYRTKSFRTRELDRCSQVRQFCADKVAEARSRRMRAYIRQVLSGHGNS